MEKILIIFVAAVLALLVIYLLVIDPIMRRNAAAKAAPAPPEPQAAPEVSAKARMEAIGDTISRAAAELNEVFDYPYSMNDEDVTYEELGMLSKGLLSPEEVDDLSRRLGVRIVMVKHDPKRDWRDEDEKALDDDMHRIHQAVSGVPAKREEEIVGAQVAEGVVNPYDGELRDAVADVDDIASCVEGAGEISLDMLRRIVALGRPACVEYAAARFGFPQLRLKRPYTASERQEIELEKDRLSVIFKDNESNSEVLEILEGGIPEDVIAPADDAVPVDPATFGERGSVPAFNPVSDASSMRKYDSAIQ